MASYQTIRKLSDGAAADVFLARGEDHEPVILEVMRRELTTHGDLVEQFLGEARLRSQLEHPHLARRVRGGHTRDGRPYVVTESIRGETLRTHLQARGALNPGQVVAIAIPVCEALQYLHDRGMVHKNLTPAAIFLPGGLEALRPKLFDASLSLLRSGRATTPRHGTSIVEAAYMAPERAKGQRADARSDLYALGVLMHESLTGRVPTADDPPPPPGQETLHAIIRRCVSQDPSSRFRSAREIRDALMEGCRHTLVLEDARIDSSPSTPGRLGPWTLLEVLGEGAIGQVFRARRDGERREVALKVMRAEHVKNSRVVKRFRDEVKALNRIDHAHIVKMEELSEESLPDGTLYCVMELLRGSTLEAVLNAEQLSLARVKTIGLQVCEALGAAHAVGVVHRDVKPANIFLVDPGERDFVKLLDFGVAKLRFNDTQPPVDRTQEGALLGTPTFMAPEQAASAEVDARADIYSLGTVLYRMLAGCLPFGGPSFSEFVSQLLHEPPSPLPRVSAGGEPVPAALAQLVTACLEKRPGNRPGSVEEVAERLRAVPTERRRANRGLIAGLCLCLLAAAVFFGRDRLLKPPPAPPVMVKTVTADVAAPAAVAPPPPAPAPTASEAPAAKIVRHPHGTKRRHPR